MDGFNAIGSGMTADERMQQVIMNNIANVSTPGFKESSGELMSFPQLLMERYNYGDGAQATPIGAMSDGTAFQESVLNFTQGVLQQTGQPLDLAIEDQVTPGTSVYALVPGGQSALAGPAGAAAGTTAQTVSSLSFVVGRGGVIETTAGDPILPVNAEGAPITDARVVKNPAYHGLELFGDSGAPVYDAAGHPSYQIIGPGGKVLSDTGTDPSAYVSMTSSVTGGVHDFFAVQNVNASGGQRVALTRDGQMAVGANHFLYNSVGQRVLALSATGQPLQNSAIEMNPAYQGTNIFGADGAPLVDQNGEVSYRIVNSQTGQPIAGAKFGTVGVNVDTLQALGQTDFVLTPTSQLMRGTATIHAGALEGSNADSTANMVQMLNIYQSYQANQTAEQTISASMQQTATQVGTVTGL